MKTISNIRKKRLALLLVLCMLAPIAISTTALAQDEPLLVTGITLNQFELELVAGEELGLLIAAVEPSNATEQEVTWSSSDELVATVVDGMVTPLAPGISEITATTIDGEYTAICEVVVEEPAISFIPVTGIYLNQTELTLTAGEDTELLVATIEPADASQQDIIWSSTDESVAIVDNGLVTPLEEGTTTVIAATADGGFTATCNVTVNEDVLPLRITQLGANVDYPLISNESADVTVDYEVDEGYGWGYSADYSTPGYDAYLAGNSFTGQADVSNIAITVSGLGIFSFDYKVSTRTTGTNCALFYNLNEPVDASNYSTSANYSRREDFRGTVPWTNEEFIISEADLDGNGQATIYIAYHKGSSNSLQDDMVAIANVCFLSGQKTLTLNIEDTNYGYITDAEGNTYANSSEMLQYEAGDFIELTAVPDEEGRFLGWMDENDQLITTNETYSFTISKDTVLTAAFGQREGFVARRNGKYYTEGDGGLQQAIEDAVSGDIIVMLEDQTLAEDAVVPAGVTFYVPYSDAFDPEGNADGVTSSDSPHKASAKIAGPDQTYRTLTIEEGATLSIYGTVNVGSVISYPGQNYQGHTSGWHGKIDNYGHIIVKNGGILDSWGLVTGEGTVIAENGSKVYEPFIVYDFAGGWNSYFLYTANYPQSPFKQYAIQNIQNELVLSFGSEYYVHCNLFADSSYNKTDIRFIGPDGLYRPASGATVTRTYDDTRYVDSNNDIGKATYTFSGGMTVSYMTIVIENFGISTEKVEFPIPYNWDIVLANGDYWLEGKIKLMPGATLTVKDDAILRVQDRFFVLDGLIQSDMSGKVYPSTEILQDAGFSGSGQLFVDGTIIVEEGAVFGGIIQTHTSNTNPATITIEKGAVVNKTNVQDGAVGNYDVNTSIFDLPARMYLYNDNEDSCTLTQLIPERTYSAHATTPWTINDYTMKYAANCDEADRSPDIPVKDGKYHKWVTTDVTLDEDRTGSWVMNDLYYTVRVINKTAYSPTDDSRVEIIADGLEDGRAYAAAGEGFSFTTALTEAGKGYVSLVTRSTGSGEPVVLTPNAEGDYVIGEVSDDVTITVTSCILGDAKLDGKIDALDLLEIRKIIVGYVLPTPLQKLAANANRDAEGNIDALDLLQIRKYIVGYINEF